MVSTVMNQPLNDAQILLLQTFAGIKSEQEKEEVQNLLLNYYQKRVDVQASQIHFSDADCAENCTIL